MPSFFLRRGALPASGVVVRALPALAALLAGCGDAAFAPKATNGAMDSEATSTASSDSGDTTLTAAWYAPGGTLTVVDGVADVADVHIDVIDATLAEVLCTAEPDLAAAVPVTDGTAPLPVWWQVSLADAGCDGLPASLGVGIGELVPDVRAQLGTVGLDDVADALFGAWFAEPGGETLSFGYAATPDDLSGDDPAALPVPDGAYLVRAVLVAPLPELARLKAEAVAPGPPTAG